MTENTPRKTLSLGTRTGETPRVRTGARARQVAINNIKKQVAEGLAQAKRTTTTKKAHTAKAERGFTPRTKSSQHPTTPRQVSRQPETQSFHIQAASADYLNETFAVFAPCPIGLEQALAAELEALGFANVKVGRSGCSFKADWHGIMKANLYSRLATRILVQVAYAKVSCEDDIYALARQVAWERWFGAEKTLRVDTSAIHSPMQSLQFCNLRTKDGIVDHLREIEGARPSIDTVRPDAKVHLFLDKDSATLYLDTSGESLFKRGWRYDKGQAPLRENLAAGILALSGWTPEQALFDPFCGSGTILIEAAWIAHGIPPGISRPFAFERLRGMPRKIWAELKEQAYDFILPSVDTPLFGSDLDASVIQAAQANLQRARLAPTDIHFTVSNALQAQAPSTQAGFLVTNPPYGERLGAESEAFWREWSGVLKNQFAGWQVHVITNDMDFPKKLRLKPKRRIPVFNGDIECRLFGFEMVADSYRHQ